MMSKTTVASLSTRPRAHSDALHHRTPIVIGFLVTDIDFASAFVYMAAITTVGVLSYVFLVGKVERVEE
ncbi:hypothetical protein PGC08_12465 [Brevibacterium sp. BDJS002]|uniref:hypothetical protein n=1 Tax=Brevibacterium sp. BDJS002 TaxID=3020906 RepID=UPI002307F160|nr:hypothetical protein [Brevibacterium sp. BDJS002]WCE38820.1 hypothetical protein PGC08_12465 [Brevibacterium sp. BDJS002]